jgi:hypothetical protein
MPLATICHLTSVHSAVDPRIFYKECRSLAKAGFAVSVVGPYPGDTVADAVRIKSIARDGSRFARMTRTVWRVYCEALKQNADIYHFHDPELIPLGLLLQARGKQVIYDIHEDLPKDILSKLYLPQWSRTLISSAANLVEIVACRRFSALVTATPSIANRFRHINRRTVVIHNYPPAEEFMHGDSIPWRLRRPSVAYVGAITLQRGMREIVSAMALLPESLPATLELAGPEIPAEASSDELRRNPGWRRVYHHGFLDHPSTFRVLQDVRAGLVVLHGTLNHLESMPLKMFEYMGAGLPVIASDFPFWRRIIGEAGCAIFVDPMNPAEIARAIEFVLTHPEDAQEMGRRGRAAVLKNFNWNSEAVKLVGLYRQLGENLCAA